MIHPGYKIQRIRAFYMRKVKFTNETISERLQQILEEFPRLDDLHPFYSDLCNVLYDRDHYKLALGQINIAKHLCQNVSRDYVRMLKYADTLYRAKQLKRAALGRMCTILKKQAATLSYLEEVRRHLSRLPSIDPTSRTLLITGFPNVGKSSFMNQVTNADVEVQPYAFTTKSLFVGHMDYKTLRWQIIDSPGVLDKPLEERNTIEMQAITALAHLQCCVLYFFDVSEQCGWTLQQQVALFRSLRPLFASKPLVIVANKTDVVPLDQLPAAQRAELEHLAEEAKAPLLPMSAMNAVGLAAVKKAACEALLERRVEQKTRSAAKMSSVLNRLTVTQPAERDARERPASIPESVLAARAERARIERDARERFRSERGGDFQDRLDLEEAETEAGRAAAGAFSTFSGTLLRDEVRAHGGAGAYSVDLRRHYQLHNPDWTGDEIPQMLDGKNVADFVDPDIEARLEQLEREEEELARDHAAAMAEDDLDSDLDEEEEELSRAISERRKLKKIENRIKRGTNRARAPTKRAVMHMDREDHAEALEAKGFSVPRGMDVDEPRPKLGSKRRRADTDDMEVDGSKPSRAGAGGRGRAASVLSESIGRSGKRARTHALPGHGAHDAHAVAATDPDLPRRGVRVGEVYANEAQRRVAKALAKRSLSQFKFTGRAGEADRRSGPKLLKHLVAGKMSMGTKRSR